MPTVPAALLDPRGVALGRMGVGVAMLIRPGLIPGVLGVDAPSRGRMSWVVQMLGAREVALGGGALSTGNDDRDRRRWLLAGILSDTVDAVAVARSVRARTVHPVSGVGLVAIAVSAAAVQVKALVAPTRARSTV